MKKKLLWFKSSQDVVGAVVVAIAVVLGDWPKFLGLEFKKYSSYSEYARAPETVKAIDRFFYGWLCFSVIVIICLVIRTEYEVRARARVPGHAQVRAPARAPAAAPTRAPAAAPTRAPAAAPTRAPAAAPAPACAPAAARAPAAAPARAPARLPAHDPAAAPAVAADPVLTSTPGPTQHASGSAPIPASASALAGPALTIDLESARVRARIRALARAIAPAGALDRSRTIARDRARAYDASY